MPRIEKSSVTSASSKTITSQAQVTIAEIEYPEEQNPFNDECSDEDKPPAHKSQSHERTQSLVSNEQKSEPTPAVAMSDGSNPFRDETLKTTEYEKRNESFDPDLNKATKAIVIYYDNQNNLINQYNLARNGKSEKLIDETNLNLNQTEINEITFIDDSFELVDDEADEAMALNNEAAVAESLNYLAETYYKNDFDRFFADPASSYDAEVSSFKFRNLETNKKFNKTPQLINNNNANKKWVYFKCRLLFFRTDICLKITLTTTYLIFDP